MTLLEVLVAVLISVIGLLGMIGLQLRAYSANVESYQRANAAILLQDMVNRMTSNQANAAAYVASDIGVGSAVVCPNGGASAAQDLCEWANLLRGAAETDSNGNNIGAMLKARGCIYNSGTNSYLIEVVWEGVNPTAAPAAVCGQNAFGAANENLRRAVTAVLQVPDLTGA
jgi:type IV pilus assembly protein PilV